MTEDKPQQGAVIANVHGENTSCEGDKSQNRYPKKPTLRSVLVQYGLPDDSNLQPHKLKKKKKNRYSLDDRVTSGRRPLVPREDSVLENGNFVDPYEELQLKIEKQRKKIQHRSELLETKLQAQELEKKEKQVAKRLQRVDLKHDAEFVHNVPKSDTYRIVKIENNLRAKGKLQTREEVEEFWEAAKDNQTLTDYLARVDPPKVEEVKTDLQDFHGSQSLSDITLDHDISQSSLSLASTEENEKEKSGDHRPMTQIMETKESSRPVTGGDPSRSWALTQHCMNLSAQYDIPFSVLKKQPRLDPHTIAKLAAAELDRKCSAPKLPQLSCFKNLPPGKEPTPQQIKECIASERREKKRRLFVHRIRKMYSLAQSNAAITKRILEKQIPDADFFFSGSHMHDLFPTLKDRFSVLLSTAELETLDEKEPWVKYIRHRYIDTIQEEDETSRQVTVISPQESKHASKTTSPVKIKIQSRSSSPKVTRSSPKLPKIRQIEPLTSVEAYSRMDLELASRKPSVFWSNYMKTGEQMKGHTYFFGLYS